MARRGSLGRAVVEPAALPLTFRTGFPLRVTGATIGMLCGLAAVSSLASSRGAIFARLTAALLLALPCLLAAGLWRRKIVLTGEGLASTGMARTRSIPWPEVLAIEQTRRSFVIITAGGDI